MIGFDEIDFSRWSPRISSPEDSSWKIVSDGECPGRWWTRHERLANSSVDPGASGVVTVTASAHE